MVLNQFDPESCLILVVDDIPNNLKLIGNILKQARYGVTFATSGQQALERVATAKPNLILLDLLMPDMDGLQVCRQLKANPDFSKTPIIFLTANHEQANLLEAFALGAADYVTKPFNQHELLARVQTHLLLQQTQAHLAHLNQSLEAQVQQRTAQLQQTLMFADILQRITERARVSLDESQVLATVVQELAQALGLARCQTGIYDLSRSTVSITHVYGVASPTAATAHHFSEFNEIYQQLLQGQIVQLTLPAASKPLYLEDAATLLICPLLNEQQVLGDLWLYRLNQVTFSAAEIRLTEQVAAQCAIAIRQARLYRSVQMQVKELEQLNYAKDDFLKTISHELRTPLTTIQMATDTLQTLLEQSEWQPKQAGIAKQAIHLLGEGCRREIRLVDHLLELIHLDTKAKPLAFEPTDLTLLVTYITQLFSQRMQQQEQTLNLSIPDDLPQLLTDPEMVERILNELLENACKYTPTGGNIKVGIAHEADRFQLCVSNFEVVMPELELDRIFETFYRLPQNDRWKQGGIGLGLALVKKRVEYLAGKISANYQGQCFTLTIEFLQPEAVPSLIDYKKIDSQ